MLGLTARFALDVRILRRGGGWMEVKEDVCDEKTFMYRGRPLPVSLFIRL